MNISSGGVNGLGVTDSREMISINRDIKRLTFYGICGQK